MKKICTVLFLIILALSAVPAEDLRVTIGNKVVANGGTWNIPMNSSSSKVALFSEQREPFRLHNAGKAPIQIESIRLKRDNGVMEEEYTLQNTALKPEPLDFKPITLEPKKSFDFYVRFYPVQSRECGATISVGYGGGKEYVFHVKGRGRDKALFTEHFGTDIHKLFGGRETDEMVTGMVADRDGNVYFTGQATSILDKFAYDLFYGRINNDGSLNWAKIWNGPYRDYTRDPGQNDESGGSAGAIDIDAQGFVYIAGSVSPSRYNNNFAALILKIDPITGQTVWERMWRPDWPGSLLAKHSAEAYALDVSGGRIYVVGTTGAAKENSDALVFILSLSAKDGSIEFQRYFDPTPKTNDRGYCVRADGKGNLYVGGLAAKVSLIAKISQVNNGNPTLEWAKTVETGWGSNINSLDVDDKGNVYASVDRRGATTYFSFLKLDPNGNLLWGKTYNGGNNKNNNCSFVRFAKDALYVGGRTGQSWYDAQMGDGKLIKVDAESGSEIWSAFYFSGKGPDEMAEHRMRGLAVGDGKLYLVGQVYTGTKNGYRYWGYWYGGVGSLSDYKPAVKDLGLGLNELTDIPAGALKDASGERKIADLKDLLEWQDAPDKNNGKPPDGDLIYWQISE